MEMTPHQFKDQGEEEDGADLVNYVQRKSGKTTTDTIKLKKLVSRPDVVVDREKILPQIIGSTAVNFALVSRLKQKIWLLKEKFEYDIGEM